MNIALEKTEEYVNGTKRRTYGDAFVRGNNGESLVPCFGPITRLDKLHRLSSIHGMQL